jgi:hypothetical protein
MGDIRRPDLVRLGDGQVSEKIRIDLMVFGRNRGLGIDRLFGANYKDEHDSMARKTQTQKPAPANWCYIVSGITRLFYVCMYFVEGRWTN